MTWRTDASIHHAVTEISPATDSGRDLAPRLVRAKKEPFTSDLGGSINLPTGYNQAYDPEIGTVYVVSVSGPEMYNVTTDFAVRSGEDTQLYQIIDVGLDELRYQARTATGRLYDAFTLRKRAGQPNELIEQLPPERRRKATNGKAAD